MKLIEMAAVQESYKWMTIFIFFLSSGFARWVTACDPSSKDLHICLNIYLERDFPLIETIMNGQSSKYGRGRIILEGMDLDNICNHISSLYNCYWSLVPECDSLWKYDRFLRVMDVLNATKTHLCSGDKANLKDLLLTSGCIIRSRAQTSNCSGFDWMMTWRYVLRMQVSPSDTCSKLYSYWDCLKGRMTDVVCGPHTAEVYEKLINVWLQHWCAMNLTPDEERKYFFMIADKREEALSKAREELDRRTELNRISRT